MTGFLPPAGEASPGASPSHEASAMPRLDGRDAWITASVFAAALAVFTFNLGDLALWSRDETTYARIAQEMLRSGDWVTLRYGGINWFCHPPLYFWLVAVSTRLLASAELAARVPSALFGAGGVALAWLWGRTTFSARAGLLSAACMAINLQYFGQSRLCIIDTTFLFFLSLSMLGFWWGMQGSRKAWYLMFLGAGLACLAKGPYGLLFPVAVGVPYVALTRQWDRLREVPWVTGLLVALPLGGAWYVVEIALWGQEFTHQVLGYYFIGRFTTQVLRQGGPFWFYVPVLLVGWFPWSLFLPMALLAGWRRWRELRAGPSAEGDALALLVVWVVLTFVGISVARTKLPNYIFFLYPAASVLVGWFLDRCVREGALHRLVAPLLVAVAMLAAIAGGLHLWAEGHYPAYQGDLCVAKWMCTMLALGLAAAAVAAFRAGGMRVSWTAAVPVVLVAACMLVFLVAAVVVVGPLVERHRLVRPLVAQARESLRGAERVACYEQDVYGVAYYGECDNVERLRTMAQLRAFLDTPQRLVLVMPRSRLEELGDAEGLRVEAAVQDVVVVSRARRGKGGS